MHLIGVDLGRTNDFAAPVIFEDALIQKPITRMPIDVPPRYLDVPSMLVRRYDLIDMQQWRGVTYPETARRIQMIVESPVISRDYVLCVDATGVGQAVVEMLAENHNLNVVGITFTSGKSVTQSQFGYNVPKRDLVVNLQLLGDLGRLRIADDLELATTFREQFRHFTSRVTTRGYEKFGGEDEEVHDDLPMAASIVLWYAEQILAHEIEIGPKKSDYDPRTFGMS